MALFLDILFAWIALGFGILLTIIFLLRVINKKCFNNQKNILYKINRFLRKHHKTIGVAIIIAGFFHGLFSSKGIFSLGLGMITWILTVLLALTFVFRQQLKKVKNWYFWHRVLSLVFVVILVWHIVDVGGFIGVKSAYEIGFNQAATSIETIVPKEGEMDNIMTEITDESANYADGIYEGIADGFGPDLTVEVTIEEGLITLIEVVSHNEQKPMFYQRPIDEIPAAIVDSQSVEVDIVSGATYTSVGIINATIDALNKAIICDDAIATLAPIESEDHDSEDNESENHEGEDREGEGKGQGKNRQ